MRAQSRWAAAALAALLLGALLQLALGNGPPAGSDQPPVLPVWVLPRAQGADLAALEARGQARGPWGRGPQPAQAAEAAPPSPPPVPVGIARAKGGFRAIFRLPQGGDLRLAAGEALPDGGRVLRVTARDVEWVDAQGMPQRHEMFNSYRIQGEAPTAVPAAPQPEGRRRARSRASNQLPPPPALPAGGAA